MTQNSKGLRKLSAFLSLLMVLTMMGSLTAFAATPVLGEISVSNRAATTATLNFKSSVAGTYFYLVYEEATTAPDAATIKLQGTSVTKGTDVVDANTNPAIGMTTLEENKSYTAYIVVVATDGGETSAVKDIDFSTDVTAPTLSVTSASSETTTGVTLNFTSDEAGTYYYLVYAASETAPTADVVTQQGTGVIVKAKGTAAATATANTVTVTGLTAAKTATSYKAYIIVEDAAGNIATDPSAISFATTADNTAPVLSATSASGITATGATLNFTSGEAGTYYYLVYAAATSAPADASVVKAQGTGAEVIAKGTAVATATANTVSVTGLTASTAYKAYVIVEDAATNASAVSTIEITTTAVAVTASPDSTDETDIWGTSGSGSSGSSSSSSSSPSTVSTTTTTSTTATTSSTAEVAPAAIAQQVAAAVQAATAKNPAEVCVQNAASISTETLKTMVQSASGKAVTLLADTMTADGSAVQCRMYIDPSKLTGLKADLKLGMSTNPDKTQPTASLFEKFFSNSISVIHCEQQGSFGAKLEIAAKVDLSKLNAKTLVFYSYDKATNTYTAIKDAKSYVDANGYLHMNTSLAGDIIVTDKALTNK